MSRAYCVLAIGGLFQVFVAHEFVEASHALEHAKINLLAERAILSPQPIILGLRQGNFSLGNLCFELGFESFEVSFRFRLRILVSLLQAVTLAFEIDNGWC